MSLFAVLDLDAATVWAALLPAVLLAQASVLLGRLREIDLSLDQQGFFATAVQLCILRDLSPVLSNSAMWQILAIVASSLVLLALILYRVYFNRTHTTSTMVVSIATGYVMIGASYFLMRLSGISEQSPSYHSVFTVAQLGTIGIVLMVAIGTADRTLRIMHQTRTCLSAAPVSLLCAAVACVVPAVALITVAATLMAVHGSAVSENLFHNFGILGATITMVAFGRYIRAGILGLFIGLVYLVGVLSTDFVYSSAFQSYGIPMLEYAIVAVVALCVNRPR